MCENLTIAHLLLYDAKLWLGKILMNGLITDFDEFVVDVIGDTLKNGWLEQSSHLCLILSYQTLIPCAWYFVVGVRLEVKTLEAC